MQTLAFVDDHLWCLNGYGSCLLNLSGLTLGILLTFLTPLLVNGLARHSFVRALLLLEYILELVHVKAWLRPIVCL